MRAAAVAILIAAALVALQTAGASAPKTFTPSVLAGTWTGTWSNQTFNSNGTLTVKVSGKAMLAMNVQIGGNTFGCAPPGPQKFAIPKGTGINHWSSKGFKLYGPSPGFGTFSATYSYPTGKIVATGKDPDCAPGLSFLVAGTWRGKAFNATATITLPAARGGGKATTVVALKRS